MQQRGRRLDEIVELLTSLWSGRTQRVTGQERIEPASLTVRPAQHPRPPILLAAYTAAGLDRIARSADGWLPTCLPFDASPPAGPPSVTAPLLPAAPPTRSS